MNEFKVGDIVHFQAYKDCKPIQAKVLGIEIGGMFKAKDDDRVFYHLSGIVKALTSVASGLSIVESRLFKPVSAEDVFK